MAQDEWIVEFYVGPSGTRPVNEFIEGLDAKAKARLIGAIERLRVLNVNAKEPLVRHIEGKLCELRRESDTSIYRLIYFFFTGRRVVFLHGFQKKTQKTPRREIETALRRMNDFMQHEEAKE